MIIEDRRQQIIRLMRENGNKITVIDLCNKLFASGATIRRDLSELELSNVLRRTHGGAILMEEFVGEDPLQFRENENSSSKQIISDFAIKYVKNGMTIFLDSSSTVFAFAKKLHNFNNLKVITNSLKTASMLSDFTNIKIMCTGGIIRHSSKSLVGLSASDFAAKYNADLCVLSCRGISFKNGGSEPSEDECYMKKKFLENSKRSLLLCDSSKVGVDYTCKLAPLSSFNIIISEKKSLNDDFLKYTKGF